MVQGLSGDELERELFIVRKLVEKKKVKAACFCRKARVLREEMVFMEERMASVGKEA